MKILHISDIVNPNGNGVAVAMSYYLKYEEKYEDVAVYNLNKDFSCECKKIFNKSNFNSISLLPNGFNKPDLVVFNEVYKKEYLKIYKYCLKNNIPYIIIPHGCLVKIAQNKKRIKKILGNLLFFNKFIKNAIAIQFLNNEEKENTKIKYKNYIISGNGVDDFEKENINNENEKELIYIGRYSIYHKGLDMLAKICNDYSSWFRNNKVKIILYGRSSTNDLEILNELIKKYKIKDILIVNGPVYGGEKRNVLTSSYAFIQTSRHEGQPMGIVEAMALGLPCIVTEGTNFSNFINEHKCGIGVKFDSLEIFNAIKKICMSNELRNDYAKNSIKSAKDYFSWNKIIKNLDSNYKSIIEGRK